jgi:UV DNA damage endonuclease
MIRFGYPTQNLTIPASTNRSLRLASLKDEDRLRSLIRENIGGLCEILRWNADHDIGLFRMGQNLIPFSSHPSFPYDWESVHGDELRESGELARSLGIRLSMHPGQYIQPSSLKPDVVERSVNELRTTARILTLLSGPDSVLVLHLGGANGDKSATARRFVEVMHGEEEALRYLALENDERIWPVRKVVDTATELGIPAITDTLHHELNPGDLSFYEALDLSLPTWERRGVRPKVHISSQNPEKQAGAHAYAIDLTDWNALLEALNGREADVMVEAKGKEHALIPMGMRVV